MKTLLLIMACTLALNGFAQTNQSVVEEKSSAWIKVLDDPFPVSKPLTIKKQNTTVRKKAKSRSVAPKQDAQQEFEKTNSQVNRFRKTKKD